VLRRSQRSTWCWDAACRGLASWSLTSLHLVYIWRQDPLTLLQRRPLDHHLPAGALSLISPMLLCLAAVPEREVRSRRQDLPRMHQLESDRSPPPPQWDCATGPGRLLPRGSCQSARPTLVGGAPAGLPVPAPGHGRTDHNTRSQHQHDMNKQVGLHPARVTQKHQPTGGRREHGFNSSGRYCR